MKREAGYYWVKFKDPLAGKEPFIARWDPGFFKYNRSDDGAWLPGPDKYPWIPDRAVNVLSERLVPPDTTK